MPKDRPPVGKRLREWRRHADLTLERAGEVIGVDLGTISRWENGRIRQMKPENVMAISKAYDVSLHEVMDLLGFEANKERVIVPRGTPNRVSEDSPPRTPEEAENRIRSLLMRSEATLIDAGATAKQRAEWHKALTTDFSVRLWGSGYRELQHADWMGKFKNYVSTVLSVTRTTLDQLPFAEREEDE